MLVEARSLTSGMLSKMMSLETPEKIWNLQRKLDVKAKMEPAFRFCVPYDKICREDILRHAHRLSRAKAGSTGVDGVSFAQIEEEGLEAWLANLHEDLVSKTYQPDPVRRVNGGERPLGIPTIRDREAQTAAKLVLDPIFETDLDDNTCGDRPTRGAVGAVRQLQRHMCQGYTDVVDADLSGCFDSIPYDALLESVARRIVDSQVLRLKVPIEEQDGDGARRIGGGKRSSRGTPQGGIVSPLPANI